MAQLLLCSLFYSFHTNEAAGIFACLLSPPEASHPFFLFLFPFSSDSRWLSFALFLFSSLVPSLSCIVSCVLPFELSLSSSVVSFFFPTPLIPSHSEEKLFSSFYPFSIPSSSLVMCVSLQCFLLEFFLCLASCSSSSFTCSDSLSLSLLHLLLYLLLLRLPPSDL